MCINFDTYLIILKVLFELLFFFLFYDRRLKIKNNIYFTRDMITKETHYDLNINIYLDLAIDQYNIFRYGQF